MSFVPAFQEQFLFFSTITIAIIIVVQALYKADCSNNSGGDIHVVTEVNGDLHEVNGEHQQNHLFIYLTYVITYIIINIIITNNVVIIGIIITS